MLPLISILVIYFNLVNVQSLTTHLSYCSKYQACGSQFVCVDNQCQCTPGTKWSNFSRSCLYFNCKNNTDCQTYDKNRYCQANGQCGCRVLSTEDWNNGRKCANKTCTWDTQCPGSYVCIGGNCQCMAGYTPVQNSPGVCIKTPECLTSTDCSTDYSRVCQYDKCQCSPGYEQDTLNATKCKPIRSNTYEHSCSTMSMVKYCSTSLGEVCDGSICRCAPNYKYNYTAGRCVYYQCKYSSECHDYDENRVCNTLGQCVCDTGYNSVSNGKCVKTDPIVNKYCFSNSQCSTGDVTDARRCVDNACICSPNYFYNTNTQKCQYFICQPNIIGAEHTCDTTYDPHRECDQFGGGCVCRDPYTVDWNNGNKCGFQTPDIDINTDGFDDDDDYSDSAIGAYVLIGIIGSVIIGSITICIRRARVKRLHSAIINQAHPPATRSVDTISNNFDQSPKTPPPPYRQEAK